MPASLLKEEGPEPSLLARCSTLPEQLEKTGVPGARLGLATLANDESYLLVGEPPSFGPLRGHGASASP